MLRLFRFLFLFICLPLLGWSQNQPEQDCNGAIRICATTFRNNTQYTGSGLVSNEAPNSCGITESNGVWYKMATNSSGSLSFTITPDDAGASFEWILYKVSNGSCPISSDLVSCNTNTLTYSINVNQNELYALYIKPSNSSQYKYDLTFTSPSPIADNGLKPTITAVEKTDYCGLRSVKVKFSKMIQAGTLVPSTNLSFVSGSEVHPAASISPSSGYASEFIVNFQYDLHPGHTYHVKLSGSPTANTNTTIEDFCQHTADYQDFQSYTPALSPISMTIDSVKPGCSGGGVINVTASEASGAPGSTFFYKIDQNSFGVSSHFSNLLSGSHTIVVSDNANCESMPRVVNLPSNGAPGIIGGNVTINCGGTATLNACGGTAYLWDHGAGTTASPSVSPTSTTVYTVTITDNNNATATFQQTVFVNSSLNAGSDVSISCGTTAILGGQNTLPAGATINWSPSLGLSGTSGLSPVASPTVTTTYTLSANYAGCTYTSDDVVVTVTALTVNPVTSSIQCGFASHIDVMPHNSIEGQPVATYSWTPTNGLSSSTNHEVDADPRTTTTYTVVATDSRCPEQTATTQVVINVSDLTVSAGSDVVVVCGSPFQLNVAGSPQVPGTTYTWSPTTGLASPSNVPSPTGQGLTADQLYNVSVVVPGCTAATDNILVHKSELVIQPTSDKTIYCGDPVQLDVSGAPPSTAYSWTPAASLNLPLTKNPIATPSVNTTYTVTANNNGCIKTGNVNVTVNSFTVNAGLDQTITCGLNTAQLSASSSLNSITYSWSPATGLSSTSIYNPVAAPINTTTYVVTGHNNNCSVTDEMVVTVNPLTVEAGVDKNIQCGTTTAQFSAVSNVTGSTYSWFPLGGLDHPDHFDPIASPTSSTTYLVSATKGGCVGIDSVKVTVDPLTVDGGIDQTIICGTTTANLTANTNFSGASFSWTPVAGLSPTNAASTVASPTITTTYSVDATKNGCLAHDEVKVTVTPINISAGADQTMVCGSNPISISTTTNSSPLTYNWTPTTRIYPSNSSATADPHATTVYNVAVTNSAGCTASDNITINVTPLLNGPSPDIALSCGGTGVLGVNTSLPGLTYLWSPANNLSDIHAAAPVVSVTTTTTYAVNITNGTCSAVDTIEASINKAQLIATFTSSFSCNSFSVNFKGTTNLPTSATYQWSFGDHTYSSDINPTHVYSSPGVYFVTLAVDDGGTCGPVTTGQYITIGTAISISLNDNSICEDETFQITDVPTNGKKYQWNFGDGNTSSTFNPSHKYIHAGNYTITLTMVNTMGCTSTASVGMNVAPTLHPSFTLNDPVCEGNLVLLNGTGGNYYTINPAVPLHHDSIFSLPPGTYDVTYHAVNGGCSAQQVKKLHVYSQPDLEIDGTVRFNSDKTEAYICTDAYSFGQISGLLTNPVTGKTYNYNWTLPDGSTSIQQSITPKIPGLYDLRVITECTTVERIVNVIISSPPVFALSMDKGESCLGRKDGGATITLGDPNDDINNYMIHWGGTSDTSASVSSLASGTAYATLINRKTLCSQTMSVAIPYIGPVVTINVTSTSCGTPTGTATANVTGGSSSYNYTWSPIISTSSGISGLAAGNYSVTVTDATSCVVTKAATVVQPVVSVSIKKPLTCGSDPVNVTATPSTSGTVAVGGYSYVWITNNAGVYSTVSGSSNINTLVAGDYRLSVTDNDSHCTVVQDFTIKSGAALSLTTTSTPPACAGSSTGKIRADVTSGSGGYIYSWADNSNNVFSASAEATGIPAGNYTLTVTDSRGCLKTSQITLNQPAPLAFTSTPASPGGCDASAEFTGGTSDYKLEWIRILERDGNNVPTKLNTEQAQTVSSAGTVMQSGIPQGDYIVRITDKNGCSLDGTYTQPGRAAPRTFHVEFAFVKPTDPGTGPIPKEDIVDDMVKDLKNDMTQALAKCLELKHSIISDNFDASCFKNETFDDELTVDYNLPYTHYTLYFHDRAGNLVRTVPPAGVHPITNASLIANIKTSRSSGTLNVNNSLITDYAYNSLDQLVKQNTPDGDTTDFIYNDISQLRFSQNKKQKLDNTFSYTKYDALGRTVEVGKSTLAASSAAKFKDLNSPLLLDYNTNLGYSAAPNNTNSEITRTIYTDPSATTYYGEKQSYLDNRVSYAFTDVDGDLTTTDDKTETVYSYDPHGNVSWLVQDIPGFSKNYIGYNYDLISNKVTKVRLNENRPDMFLHKYTYDEDNRISGVLTSRDGYIWDKDASYDYFDHGPLKRMKLGEDKIQGLDYTYTIEGWLKAVNQPELTASKDPGGDGTTTSEYMKDVFGMSLGYYNGDYTKNPNLSTVNQYASTSNDLFNGNISSWTRNIDQSSFSSMSIDPYKNHMTGQVFAYDKLNRLKSSDFKYENSGWQNTTAFGTSYSFDANGNIMSLNRNAYGSSPEMDKLGYNYFSNSNKLHMVTDQGANTAIDGTMNDIYGTTTYDYDGIGNLVSETGTHLVAGVVTPVATTTDWNLYGKVKQVNINDGGVQKTLKFAYDASGNRIMKDVANSTTDLSQNKTTFYVRDASGNIMGVYERSNENKGGNNYEAVFNMREEPIYGSDRLGQVSNIGTDFELARIPFTAPNTAVGQFQGDGLNSSSELKNWISPADKPVYLGSDTSDYSKICDCEIKQTAFGLNPGLDPAKMKVLDRFIGKSARSVVVGEAPDGTPQFYAVTAKAYLSGMDVMMLYDKDGNLMKGGEDVTLSDGNAKPVAMKKPGTNNIYYLFTFFNGNLYYHLIDMSLPGFTTGSTPAGEVTSANNIVDPNVYPYTLYGRHMTAISDEGTSTHVLYAQRNTPSATGTGLGVTEIVAFPLDASSGTIGQPEVMTYVPSMDIYGDGELQLSPDLKHLAYYNRLFNVGGFDHQQVELNIFNLNSDRKSLETDAVTGNVLVQKIAGSSAGTFANGSMEFPSGSKNLFFNQWGIYKEPLTGTEKNTFQYNAGTATNNLISTNQFGTLRRGKDGKLYIPGLSNYKQFNTIEESGSGVTVAGAADLAEVSSNYYLTGHLAVQTYRVKSQLGQKEIFTRTVDDKMYELKDHLGNVNMVVSDMRDASISSSSLLNVPKVNSSTDYYAFGMQMPGRNVSSANYVYAMNGQMKTDEIAGSGNHNTALFWEYDTRTARRWNTDPKPFASISDYAAFSNNPIWFQDIFGDIFRIGNKDEQAKKDITNLAKSKNQKYIKVNESGDVTLDFGDLNKEKINKIIGKDDGLSLINNLSNAKDGEGCELNFFYGTQGEVGARDRNTGKIVNIPFPAHPAGFETDKPDFFLNISQTPYSKALPYLLPKAGYQGQVMVANGTGTIAEKLDVFNGKGEVTGQRTVIRNVRTDIIIHELKESYLRTTMKLPYQEAHDKAGGTKEVDTFIFK